VGAARVAAAGRPGGGARSDMMGAPRVANRPMQTSLLSSEFLAIAFAAIVLLGALRGWPRAASFTVLNVLFLWAFLGPIGTASTVAFCALGYALLRAVQARSGPGLGVVIGVAVALFAWMRQYELLTWMLPEPLITRILATAGLSFLLFKILHLLIEARSGTLGPIDAASYVNYCLNFTTFLMGPIQRFPDFREQWSGEREPIPRTFEAHLDAVLRILVGFVKAYVLAIWFEQRGLRPDTDLTELNLVGWFFTSYCFYFYLYLNFSGYCDVVIGVGSLMGVRPPENFDKPFISRNISDFWQRQHRSLTLWLTDYVFSPAYKRALESERFRGHTLLAANGALMLTMLVSGLWHGTTLAFLFFGLAHGLYQVVYRSWDTFLTRRWGRKRVRAFRERWDVHLIGIALTFNATAFAFVFFRVETSLLLDLARQWTGA
jgi:D-alanyl-lipoteichoic acid acyltransferase DltB (MBOAT superfamily)